MNYLYSIFEFSNPNNSKLLHFIIDLYQRKFFKLSPEDMIFLRYKKFKVDYNVHGDLCNLYKMFW